MYALHIIVIIIVCEAGRTQQVPKSMLRFMHGLKQSVATVAVVTVRRSHSQRTLEVPKSPFAGHLLVSALLFF